MRIGLVIWVIIAAIVSGTAPIEPELSELMMAYQAGRLEAFDALYAKLAPKLRGYLSSHTYNASLTEDLLQETFLQIHRSRHTYAPPRPVRPWVFAIARHVYLMHRRASARRYSVETAAPGELPEVPVPPAMEQLGSHRDVWRALAELSDDRREAVLLHHVWGFTFGEIGAMLGIRAGTAKLRAHRAISALRTLLASPDARGGARDPR